MSSTLLHSCSRCEHDARFWRIAAQLVDEAEEIPALRGAILRILRTLLPVEPLRATVNLRVAPPSLFFAHVLVDATGEARAGLHHCQLGRSESLSDADLTVVFDGGGLEIVLPRDAEFAAAERESFERIMGRLGTIADKLYRLTRFAEGTDGGLPLPTAAESSTAGGPGSFATLVGASPAMRRIRRALERASHGEGAVLLTGETGTGKELAARALHDASGRSGPWVAINCAGLQDLVASRLFGHVRGAFTGATGERMGAFRRADGGTLFLDEINSMPLAAQGQLLRVLQTREVIPLGSDTGEKVDVRLICATNEPLTPNAAAGQFRRDLYYRIAEDVVSLPPLRNRPEDIPLLVQHILLHTAARHSRPCPRLGPGALDLLCAHDWPGNVRELEHVLHRTFPNGDVRDIYISAAQVAAALHPDGPPPHDLGSAEPDGYVGLMAAYESQLLRRRLDEAHGNVALAARGLDISRQRLSGRMKKLGIRGAKAPVGEG